MTSDGQEKQASVGSAVALARRDLVRFFKMRQRVYGGLLLFVVVVGLPIVIVPSLRLRLTVRAMALKTAVKGIPKPAIARVGENQGPLPAEFQRPAPVLPRPLQLPPLDRIFTKAQDQYVVPSPARRVREAPKPVQARKEIPALIREEATAEPVPSDSEPSSEPRYQRGKAEQEAYEMLIKSVPAVAAMVQGTNRSLRFISWDAANRGEDNFWVRLKFQTEGSPEIEYIWLVKLQSNQVTPLNYNARGIS